MNRARTNRAAKGRSRRRRVRGAEVEAIGGAPFSGGTNRWERQRLGDGGEDALAGLGEGGVEDGPGGLTMAAAAEVLGDGADVDAGGRAETDLDAAARLLHEQQADLGPGDAAGVVDQLLGVLRDGTGCGVVVAVDLGPGDAASGRG